MRSIATFTNSIRHSREGGAFVRRMPDHPWTLLSSRAEKPTSLDSRLRGNDEHKTIPGSRLPIPGGPA
jgi:hypothetical protein